MFVVILNGIKPNRLYGIKPNSGTMRTQVSQSAYVLKRADVNELQAHRCMTPWQWTWFLCTVSVVPANKLSFQELNQIIGIKLLHSGFLDIPVFHSQFPEEGKCPFSSPPAHMSGWFAGHNDRTIKQGSLDSSAHFQRATMIGIGKLKRPIGDCRRKEYPHGKVFVLRKLFVEKNLYLMSGSLLQNSCSRSLDSSMSWLFMFALTCHWHGTWCQLITPFSPNVVSNMCFDVFNKDHGSLLVSRGASPTSSTDSRCFTLRFHGFVSVQFDETVLDNRSQLKFALVVTTCIWRDHFLFSETISVGNTRWVVWLMHGSSETSVKVKRKSNTCGNLYDSCVPTATKIRQAPNHWILPQLYSNKQGRRNGFSEGGNVPGLLKRGQRGQKCSYITVSPVTSRFIKIDLKQIHCGCLRTHTIQNVFL